MKEIAPSTTAVANKLIVDVRRYIASLKKGNVKQKTVGKEFPMAKSVICISFNSNDFHTFHKNVRIGHICATFFDCI